MTSPPGDPSAILLDLYERYGDWIRARVRGTFPNEWEDVMQDVMLKLGRAVGSLRDRRDEAVRALISRTVRSVCVDEIRRRARHPMPVHDEGEAEIADPGSPSPVQEVAAAESRSELSAAWAALPERERQILRLRFHDGLGFREIAEVLGVPQGSVAGWYSRALARLRETLQ